MAFTGSSFNLWLDSGLTSPFSGIQTIINKTDLSDNPQDFTFYLGSSLANRQLQAASSPGVANIVLTPADTLPIWIANTAYVVGQKVQPIAGNGFVYRCSVSGTSGSSEPSWPVSPLGATVADGGCTWALTAVHHPKTEIKLALSSGAGLTAATGGAQLNVATTILGGVGTAVPIYMRITNTVTTVSNDTGNEEMGININSCIETETV